MYTARSPITEVPGANEDPHAVAVAVPDFVFTPNPASAPTGAGTDVMTNGRTSSITM